MYSDSFVTFVSINIYHFFAFSTDVYRYPETEANNADSSLMEETEEYDKQKERICSLEFDVNQGVLLAKTSLYNDNIFRESSSKFEHATNSDKTSEEHCSFVMDETLARVTMKFLPEDISENTIIQTNNTKANGNIEKIAGNYILESETDKKTIASIIKSDIFRPEIQSTSNPKECIGVDVVSLTNVSSSLQVRTVLQRTFVYSDLCTLH